MPSPKSFTYWTLSEFLGQRKLLGLGALLAWLVLFHLLVNVWLLCIFTSLLVVLGGWLGSRVALDANSLLHLEHFLPLEEDGEFEHAVRNSMLESVMELKERAWQVDRKALVQRVLELYGCHLQSYMTARQMQAENDSISLWQLYSEVDAPHPAVRRAAAELSYSRALVNLALHVLVPYPQLETRTGAYVVTELITCNVLLPLISRACDPDWLNQTIVDLFTKSRESQEINMKELPVAALYRGKIQQESWTTCHSLSSNDADLKSKSLSDLNNLQCQSLAYNRDSSQSSMVSLMSSGKVESCHAGLLPSCRVNCFYPESDHESNSSECKIFSVESLTESDAEYFTGGICDCGPPANLCNMITLTDDEAPGCFGPLKALGPKVMVSEDSQWSAGVAQEKSPACPQRKFYLSSYNFDIPNNQVTPVSIQNMQIVGTITAKEQRGNSTHPYTLYTVKFEMVVHSESSSKLSPVVCRTVNQRYSEFLNLQTHLEEKPELKKLLKNVKGPKKIFPDLPFGSVDSERIETHKGQLDIFLKVQMMENALDTLKTAFPHPEPLSPTEDMEGDAEGRAVDYRKYRRLMFSSKISPSLNIPDLHPKVAYCFSAGSSVLNGMTLSGLESFVKEQERLLSKSNGKESVEAKPKTEQPGKDKTTSGKSHGTDTAVADVALNILCILMKDQWSWLCTENIQQAIRLLFGTFIERWVDVGVAHLTSAPCWVIYLQVLQEAVWPGGMLPAQPWPERSATQKEETKERCLECLVQLLPELITDMLGTEKYRRSLETMLGSLQDHHINKHLLYCICDLLLEFLVPESCEEAFQTSLLQSLTKDIERENFYT
ncbi:hypothetical protein LDENG_00066910 [Lucifuga dentata]|nr:hypothetical protein LDENG_00066910 [Lucifuga dentata]